MVGAPSVTFTTNQIVTIFTEKPSGDGSSESAPGFAYLPVQTAAASDNANALLFNNTALNLINIDSKQSSDILNVSLSVVNTNGDGDRVVQVAVQDDGQSTFEFFDTVDLDTVSNNSSTTVTKSFTMAELCSEIGDTCDAFGTDGEEKEIILYFFPALSTDSFQVKSKRQMMNLTMGFFLS